MSRPLCSKPWDRKQDIPVILIFTLTVFPFCVSGTLWPNTLSTRLSFEGFSLEKLWIFIKFWPLTPLGIGLSVTFVQATFVLDTFLHIRNISAVTDAVLTKL